VLVRRCCASLRRRGVATSALVGRAALSARLMLVLQIAEQCCVTAAGVGLGGRRRSGSLVARLALETTTCEDGEGGEYNTHKGCSSAGRKGSLHTEGGWTGPPYGPRMWWEMKAPLLPPRDSGSAAFARI